MSCFAPTRRSAKILLRELQEIREKTQLIQYLLKNQQGSSCSGRNYLQKSTHLKQEQRKFVINDKFAQRSAQIFSSERQEIREKTKRILT